MTSSLTSFDAVLRDMYPRPGERIKQYVVDMRRESAWERETCPCVKVNEHEDNTGAMCRNSHERALWVDLGHDCCEYCNELMEMERAREDVQAWLALKATRPPVERDRTKLSDEVQPDISLASSPTMRMVRR